MKPNDQNASLPPGQRPFRILIISGSERRQEELGLNQDTGLHPKKSEGEKLRGL